MKYLGRQRIRRARAAAAVHVTLGGEAQEAVRRRVMQRKQPADARRVRVERSGQLT